MKVLLLKNLVLVLLCLVSVLVVVGSILNEHNHKYSRSKNTTCSHGILVLNEPDSHMCCASTHYENTWICSASFDYINSIISSKWAFFIPLLPLLANVVFANGWRGSAWLRRLGVYLALFLLRTVCFVSNIILCFEVREFTISWYAECTITVGGLVPASLPHSRMGSEHSIAKHRRVLVQGICFRYKVSAYAVTTFAPTR